jgi:acyl carrier protein
MNEMDATSPTPIITEKALCDWMIQAVGRLARVDAATLGPATAFEDLGLSSLAAVTLASDLSDAFAIEVDALVTWDYPTIGEVAEAIASGRAGSRRPD